MWIWKFHTATFKTRNIGTHHAVKGNTETRGKGETLMPLNLKEVTLLNVARMKKIEIIWMQNHKCKHGHNYLEHQNCYFEENPNKERLGFFDIETTNLKADFGIILQYCIADQSSDKVYSRTITKKELTQDLDRKVVKQCLKDMGNFDRLVGYYSSRFDIPFIRTRAVALGLEFPEYGGLLHQDLYFVVRNRFNLSSKRLENACRVLLGSTDKTRIDSEHWIRALQGDPGSLDYIRDHCEKDVIDLKKLYNKIIRYSRRTDTSL